MVAAGEEVDVRHPSLGGQFNPSSTHLAHCELVVGIIPRTVALRHLQTSVHGYILHSNFSLWSLPFSSHSITAWHGLSKLCLLHSSWLSMAYLSRSCAVAHNSQPYFLVSLSTSWPFTLAHHTQSYIPVGTTRPTCRACSLVSDLSSLVYHSG